MTSMDDNNSASARKTIEASAIIRLIGLALLSLLLARRYSHEPDMLRRIISGPGRLIAVSAAFLADAVMTVLWIYKPGVFRVHLALFAVGGIFEFLLFLKDITNTSAVSSELMLVIAAVCIWNVNLLFFVTCGEGIKELNRNTALSE